MTALPRGVRLNNPGNGRRTRDAWQGEIEPGRDAEFMTFDTMAHGVRFAAKVLLGYQARGLVTIAQMIGRWAPPSENDTAAYVKAVAAACGLPATARISLGEGMLVRMCRAIFHHENGGDFVSAADIDAGCRMALGLAAAPPATGAESNRALGA